MKVKIGIKIINSNDQPLMIIFSDDEKEMIGNMVGQDLKFCCFPKDSNVQVIEEFMKIEDPNQLSMSIDNDVAIINIFQARD